MTLSSQEKQLFQKRVPFMTPFFTLFVLSRASDNTTSQNIEGTDAWAVPHLTFLGGTVPPVLPRSPPLAMDHGSSTDGDTYICSIGL